MVTGNTQDKAELLSGMDGARHDGADGYSVH